MVPFDTQSPFVTSGIRVGTAGYQFWTSDGYDYVSNNSSN